MSDTINKTEIVPYVNRYKDTEGKTDWVQIKKATSFTLNLNPETEEYDFISSKQKETVVKSYAPSLDVPLTMQRGEDDYNIFFDAVYGMPVGADASRKVLLVFYQEKGIERIPVMVHDDVNNPNGDNPDLLVQKKDDEGALVFDDKACYKAWECDGLLTPNSLDSVAAQISINLNFSNVIKGAVAPDANKKPVFKAGEWTFDETLKQSVFVEVK